MKCPDLRNPEIAAKIKIVAELMNENIAKDLWSENNGHGFNEGPTGEPSLLQQRLIEAYGNKFGIISKADIYDDEFINKFGEWKNEISTTKLSESKSIQHDNIEIEPIDEKISKKLYEKMSNDVLSDLVTNMSIDKVAALDTKLAAVFKTLYPQIGLEYTSKSISQKKVEALSNNDYLLKSQLTDIYNSLKENIDNISNRISNIYDSGSINKDVLNKLEIKKNEYKALMQDVLNTYSGVEDIDETKKYIFPKRINDVIDKTLNIEFSEYKEALKNNIDALPLIINLTNKYAKTLNKEWYENKNTLLEHMILYNDNIWTRDGIVYAETQQGQVSFHTFGYEGILAHTFGLETGNRQWSGIPTQMNADELLRDYIRDNDIERNAPTADNNRETYEDAILKSLENSKKVRNIMFQKNNKKIVGAVNTKAMTILLDSVNRNIDTLPHEYAHVYIGWYRNNTIVKDAIKKWGSEEALVQAIGEQVVYQKGEAYNWWRSFWEYIRTRFSTSDNNTKERLKELLTNSLLQNVDLDNNKINLLLDSSNEPASYNDGDNVYTIGKNGNRIYFDEYHQLDDDYQEKGITKDDEFYVSNEIETLAKDISTEEFLNRVNHISISDIQSINPTYSKKQAEEIGEYIKAIKIIEERLKEYGFEPLDMIGINAAGILHAIKVGSDMVFVTEQVEANKVGFFTLKNGLSQDINKIIEDTFNSVYVGNKTFAANGTFSINNDQRVADLFGKEIYKNLWEVKQENWINDFIPKINKRALNNQGTIALDMINNFDKVNRMKNAEIFAKTIKNMFPSLNIKVYNNDNVDHDRNVDGFVDENGIIYINGSIFNPKTGLHEFGHILEPILQQANSEVYEQIMSIIEKGLSEDGSIAKLGDIIRSKYEEKDELLSWKKLKSEVFAEMLASINYHNIDNMLLYAGIISDEEFSRDIRNFGYMIFNGVNNIFDSSDIEELFLKLNYEIKALSGKRFSDDQIAYLNDYFKNSGTFYRMEYENVVQANKTISTIGDIHDNLIGNKYVAYSPTQLAKNIIKSMKSRGQYDATYKYRYNDKTFQFSKSLSENELIREVIDKIANDKYKAIHSKKDKIKEAIDEFKNGGDLVKTIQKAIGKGTTVSSANNLINYLGLNSGVSKIFKLSELKNSNIKEFQQIHNIDFGNFDPLIVVHSLTDGELDVSFIDFTYDNINPKQMIIEDNNIFSKHMSTSDYFNKTGNLRVHNRTKLRNTDVDIKNFQLGLLALHMQKELGSKFHLRKLGTINTNQNNTNAKMVNDLRGLINNIVIASNSETLMKTITNKAVLDLFNSAKDYNDNIKQSFMGQLMTYLDLADNGGLKDPYLHYSYRRNMRALFKNNMSVAKKIKQINAIKRYIEVRNDEGYMPDVYHILAGFARELRTGELGAPDDVDDMTTLAVSLTAANNVRNAHLQDVVEIVQKAKTKIVNIVSNDIKSFMGTTKEPGLFTKVYNRRIKNNPELLAGSLLTDKGSAIFEHLYKRKEVNVVKDGIVVRKKKVKLLKLHINKNDVETKDLMSKGILTEDDLAFSREILRIQKEKWIDKILFEEKKRRQEEDPFVFGKLTRQEAAKMYDNAFAADDIVTISKSTNELLFSGNFKEAYEKYANELNSNDFIMEDIVSKDISSDNSYVRMNDYFAEQFDEIERLNQVGLDLDDNGEYILKDEKLNEYMSTDAWKTHLYLEQSLVRKQVYEESVLPVVKDSVTLMKQLEVMGKSQSQSLRFLKEYIDGNAFRKNQDDDKTIKIPLVGEVKVSTTMRSLAKAYNTAVLPFKLGIGVFSMVFNMNRVLTESLSSSIAGGNHIVPKLKYFLEATPHMFSQFKLIKTLSKDMQLWDSDERDMISSPFRNKVNKKIYDEAFTNFLNWATDTFTRSLAMVAKLKETGSFEAYSYDKDSGEVLYDETKDRQWYNSDGTLREDNKDNFLLLKAQLAEQGLVKNGKLMRGYSDVDTHNMKYIADKYLIGSFSPETKVMVANRWYGQIQAQFRLFSPDRLNNFGMFGDYYSTKLGSKEKAIRDEDGNLISRRERREMESMLNSVNEAWKAITKFGKYTPKEFSEWYSQQSTERRYNLIKSFIQLTMFSIMVALSRGFKDKDDKLDKQLNKFIGDILIMGTIADFVKSPFPSLDALVRFINGNLTQFVPLSGAAKEYMSMIDNENNKDKKE